MELMRFEPPLRGLEKLSESLNRFFTTPFDRGPVEESLTVTEWSPAVDIEETEKEYLVKVEIPEVKKEAVKVLVEDGTLTIRGERRKEKEEKNARFHRMERTYGNFFRSFTLPIDVDEKKVTAEFADGMLKVHLLKSENAKPRTVEIKVN